METDNDIKQFRIAWKKQKLNAGFEFHQLNIPAQAIATFCILFPSY